MPQQGTAQVVRDLPQFNDPRLIVGAEGFSDAGVFQLRDDVRWSDGHPLTAGDFVFAWKRALHPTHGSPAATVLYDVVGAVDLHQGRPGSLGVSALDAYTLQGL